MSLFKCLAVVAVAAVSTLPTVHLGAQSREGRIHATVFAQDGWIVPASAPTDFTVREDGVSREVLRVMPATGPMQIALLVDNSQAATGSIVDIRKAVTAFIDELQGNEIALIGYGDRPTVLVDYTENDELLKRGISRLLPAAGQRRLSARRDHRCVARSPEARGDPSRDRRPRHRRSRVQQRPPQAGARAAQGQRGRAERPVPVPTGDQGDDQERRERNIVLNRGTLETGGRRDTLLAAMAFSSRIKTLAAELKSQQVMVYGRPESLMPPQKIEVSTVKPGLTVRGTPGRVEGT